MAKRVFQPLAGGVPEPEIGVQIDIACSPGRYGDRQAAAGADRRDRAADLPAQRSIAPQTCERCSRSVPEPMCMCRPVIVQAVMVGQRQAVGELLVPDAVLRLLAAGVGLLAVAVAEAGVDPQRDLRGPARARRSWSIMSGEPQLTCIPCSTHSSSASRSKISAV